MAVSEFWRIESRHNQVVRKCEALTKRVEVLEATLSSLTEGGPTESLVDKIMKKKPIKKLKKANG